MKLQLTVLLILNISMNFNTCKAMTEFERINIITTSVREWLEACSWQAEAKKNLWEPKNNLTKSDLEKVKQTKKELKNANENEVEKHKNLEFTLKELCPNRRSQMWKIIKEIEAHDRLQEQPPNNQNVYKCLDSLAKETKQCSCKQPTFWGKMQNLFSQK